jgi:hypothetical protein
MGILSAEWRQEKLREQFYAWEKRGRGWQVFEEPVALEPPFRPFTGHFLPPQKPIDDGRSHTLLSGFLAKLSKGKTRAEEEPTEEEPEPEPEFREPQNLVELQMSLPLSRSVPTPQVESFLRHACRPSETLALEILGTERETVPQFVASPRAATRIGRAVEACFPGIVCATSDDALESSWQDGEPYFAVAELGLGNEFMLPLGSPRSDVLAGVVTAMDGVGKNELALFQVLFEKVENEWDESIVAAATDGDGKPFFVDRPDLTKAAEQKIASPLFAVVIRLASSACDMERAWEIIADMAAPLSAFSRSGSNYLIPLRNNDYQGEEHERDILTRMSRRSGMLLNMEELTSLITPPFTANSKKLRRETKRTNPAPEMLTAGGSLSLGMNMHAGKTREIFLSPEHRVRHTHVIGASGFGKTTFLENLIVQDIERGEGVAVLDPHGDLIDSMLGRIPPERKNDVILIDPSDEEYSVGLNILAAHSDFEKSLLASDLTSVFRRLSTSWGDQMESVLRNSILAFLESKEGGTLADLRHFLIDAAFRKQFLQSVTDPEIVYYWTKAFPQLTGGKSIGPLLTRLDEFLSRKPIRYMVSQSKNRFDFAEILDGGKILLAKLPQGLIGRENAALLGSLIITKLQMAAMSRQRMPKAERRDFWCYIDEFQHFITPSMAEILAGARKYRLGLILAHQELRHLDADRDVAGAVLSNCYTRVVFKVGDADARAMENGFSHFEARDLMNLSIGEALCRVERSDFDFNLTVPKPTPQDEDAAAAVRQEVIVTSRAKYARSRADIDAEVLKKRRSEGGVEKRPEAPVSPAPIITPQPSAAPPVFDVRTVSAEETVQVQPPEPKEHPPQKESRSRSGKIPSIRPAETQEKTDAQPEPPPSLGRGGVQHRAIQEKLKASAEEKGFRVTVEKSVFAGRGSIDLVLEKPGSAIAVEINVTSTIDYEVGNVSKCLRAGFAVIVVVCPHHDQLARLERAVKGCLMPEQSAKVSFCAPDEFVAILDTLTIQEAATKSIEAPPEKRTRGYNVKSHFVQVSPEEAKAREETALGIIAKKLRPTT